MQAVGNVGSPLIYSLSEASVTLTRMGRFLPMGSKTTLSHRAGRLRTQMLDYEEGRGKTSGKLPHESGEGFAATPLKSRLQ
jgi:hypothetical protein